MQVATAEPKEEMKKRIRAEVAVEEGEVQKKLRLDVDTLLAASLQSSACASLGTLGAFAPNSLGPFGPHSSSLGPFGPPSCFLGPFGPQPFGPTQMGPPPMPPCYGMKYNSLGQPNFQGGWYPPHLSGTTNFESAPLRVLRRILFIIANLEEGKVKVGERGMENHVFLCLYLSCVCGKGLA